MLYMNMGHGDKIFTSPVQNTLIENELRGCWARTNHFLWDFPPIGLWLGQSLESIMNRILAAFA
jgi:hypothetical protein